MSAQALQKLRAQFEVGDRVMVQRRGYGANPARLLEAEIIAMDASHASVRFDSRKVDKVQFKYLTNLTAARPEPKQQPRLAALPTPTKPSFAEAVKAALIPPAPIPEPAAPVAPPTMQAGQAQPVAPPSSGSQNMRALLEMASGQLAQERADLAKGMEELDSLRALAADAEKAMKAKERELELTRARIRTIERLTEL